MKYVVTGAAGFIGSHLVDRLISEGHDVVGVDNLFTGSRKNLSQHARFEFIRADVCDPFHIDCDGLFHLACPASPVHYQRNAVRTIRTAVQGTISALECARDVKAKVVIASTSEVYGDPEVHPQPETYVGSVNPVGPRSCYDEGKRCAESLAVAWGEQYSVPIGIARIFNTYGPRMAAGDGRLLPNFITQAIRGEPLTVYGDGTQTRSLCYVTDTVDGLCRLMRIIDEQHDPAYVVNIGNPDERTVHSVARDVIKRFGEVSPAGNGFMLGEIRHLPLPQDDPRRRCPDITRAREWLHWEPAVAYELGIALTVDWFRAQPIG